jgi:translation initiation factor IF-3
MDLVEVAPNARPPVCKIMDYGKWRYQQQKKEDKSRASNRGGQLKELKFKTVKIGDHDLMIKVNHAKGFLEEGNKVQFTLQFRGREMAHLELGRDIFKKIKDALWLVSKIERDAKMEGRRMTMVLQPDHKSPDAVKPVFGGTAPQAARAGSGDRCAAASGNSGSASASPSSCGPATGGSPALITAFAIRPAYCYYPAPRNRGRFCFRDCLRSIRREDCFRWRTSTSLTRPWPSDSRSARPASSSAIMGLPRT